MTGTSYNGTLPVAAATTGVKGLEAIIPDRAQHVVLPLLPEQRPGASPGRMARRGHRLPLRLHQQRRSRAARVVQHTYRDGEFARGRDRASGDYNAFWAERDLLKKVGKIKAAVLMAHAFNDWNVVPEHSVRIAMALKGRVPLQMYFHQGGHGGAPPMEMMNRWFTRYLYGVQNGVEKDPKAWIVREAAPVPAAAAAAPAAQPPATPPAAAGQGRGRTATPPPTPYADYPNPAASPVTLHLAAGRRRARRAGPGSGGQAGRRDPGRQRRVQRRRAGEGRAVAEPAALCHAGTAAPLHISGTASITLRLASSKPAANLSVWLVTLPWTDGPIGPANLITRGWADPQNHASLKNGGDYHSMAPGKPLTPGQFYRMTFDLQPDDQIIPAGKRIGLMIFSSDRDFTLWPKAGTELTLDLAGTTLRLPIVGGAAAFRAATAAGVVRRRRPPARRRERRMWTGPRLLPGRRERLLDLLQMLSKFLFRSFSSSFVRILRGTRIRFFSNFTFSQVLAVTDPARDREEELAQAPPRRAEFGSVPRPPHRGPAWLASGGK